EETKVQDRLAATLRRCNSAQLGLCPGSGERRRLRTAHPMDLLLRNLQRGKQEVASHAEIAFRVVRRHAALVDPKEMHRTQRTDVRREQSSNSLKKVLCDSSSCKRNAVGGGSGRRTGTELLKPLLRSGFGKGPLIRERNDFHVAHSGARLSASSDNQRFQTGAERRRPRPHCPCGHACQMRTRPSPLRGGGHSA